MIRDVIRPQALDPDMSPPLLGREPPLLGREMRHPPCRHGTRIRSAHRPVARIWDVMRPQARDMMTALLTLLAPAPC